MNASTSHNGIARNWAREKIEALEDAKMAGGDPVDVREQALSLANLYPLTPALSQ